MRDQERADFLNPIIEPSMEQAAEKGMSLTLVRPHNPIFSYEKKTEAEMSDEKRGYIEAASQLSFMDAELKALSPCPYRFFYEYETEDGKPHRHSCQDWETEATFENFKRRYGEQDALSRMSRIFGNEYPARGMVFGMGTHSQRPDQWLLVGVIRLDESQQLPLQLSF